MSCVTDTHLMALLAHRLAESDATLVMRASRHPWRILPDGLSLRHLSEPFKRLKMAAIYRRADALVALSPDNAAGLRDLLGWSGPRVETILNPVVTTTLLDTAATRQYRSCGEPLILGIGRLVDQKDFGALLHALARLRARRRARLVLLGGGAQAAMLTRLAGNLGIAADFILPGEVSDVERWVRRADVVVSTSRWEGLQATLIEAMALGRPVVATDCPGGARDALQNGRLGPLVPVGDDAALAEAIEHVLDNPPDPMQLAAGAARFTHAGKAEQYLALFDACRTHSSVRWSLTPERSRPRHDILTPPIAAISAALGGSHIPST